MGVVAGTSRSPRGNEPLTGKRVQITKRGYRTATDASLERRALMGKVETGQVRPISKLLTSTNSWTCTSTGWTPTPVSPPRPGSITATTPTCTSAPHLGTRKVRDITPAFVLAWQRKLMKDGAVKNGRPLAPNTVRLARAPLSASMKLAIELGVIAVNPLMASRPPRAQRSIPRHWTLEQAREFLGFMEDDRTYPIWAFLLGSGLRVGELVWLRWGNVDLERRRVHVVEFVSALGYDLVASSGKSRDAVRSIELDAGLVRILRAQRKKQAEEQLASPTYVESDHVFTRPTGGRYHPANLSKLPRRMTSEVGLPRLTAHGLRHTSATLMLAKGVPPKVASERLGHADPTLFTNLYSHVTPTMQREAADKIGAALFE
jgi:integrase